MKRNLLIVLVVFIIIALAGGGFLLTRNKDAEPEPTTETFVTTETEPTDEPEKVIEKTDYPILIQNGSGKEGAAGVMQKHLEDAGYAVSDTENADSYDFVKTEIRAKSSVPSEFVDGLRDDIPDDYTVVIGEELGDDDDADVIVIVGSDGTEPAKNDSDDDEAAPTTKPAAAAPTSAASPTVSPTPTKTP